MLCILKTMIDPLPIFINCENMEMFKDIPNIKYSKDADITIDNPIKGKYNVRYSYMGDEWIPFQEDWVETLESKLFMRTLEIKTLIIVLTDNKEMLPYCMKDRLATLQDRINKKQITL